EDGIRDFHVTGVQTCALPIFGEEGVRTRPLLLGGDPLERLAAILAERMPWYERADLWLETAGISVDQVAGAIVGLLRQVEGPMRSEERRVGKEGRSRGAAVEE